MCNRVSAAEFREIKIRWNLFNDLPEFKSSHNIAPDRGDILTVVRTDAGNAGRLMYLPLIPSFAKTMNLEYSTSNASADATTGGHLAICKINQVLALKTVRQVLSKAQTRHQ